MKMLAVDCCLKLTGAALSVDGKILGHVQGDYGRKQSSELPRICAGLMESAGLAWNELDYVAITAGPGYFTGIRVGAAYATGLAYASGAKILPVSTLDLLPYTFRKSQSAGKILTVIYAGHGYVYASCDGVLVPGEYSGDGGIFGPVKSSCGGNVLVPGEYSHAQILDWLGENPDAITISDDPERTGLDADMMTVKPDMLSLCEIARGSLSMAVNPAGLKINYYRAPQGAS